MATASVYFIKGFIGNSFYLNEKASRSTYGESYLNFEVEKSRRGLFFWRNYLSREVCLKVTKLGV
ncbi:hypothetical protein GCM10007876_07530 [Litoribrevibacter albus]|uniref:Uncharacterized protein n=1 Tax=Litoribrevibacter albus TaxID=1473156 RepID=A0AA37S8K8_9GAMM|nr:hypothetical protein GCM10007876_07530 [Litoribrevibacter albus]